jgi:hypothetical protein
METTKNPHMKLQESFVTPARGALNHDSSLNSIQVKFNNESNEQLQRKREAKMNEASNLMMAKSEVTAAYKPQNAYGLPSDEKSVKSFKLSQHNLKTLE